MKKAKDTEEKIVHAAFPPPAKGKESPHERPSKEKKVAEPQPHKDDSLAEG